MPRKLLCLLVFLPILGCVVSAPPRTDAPGESTESVSVMTFNIEWGGTKVSFENVVEAIRRSGADIVGVQEAEGNLQRLAGALGWHYDLRNYVISRYPLIEPPGADGQYVFAEITPGRIVAIANVHLPSDPYGPDAIRDGASIDEVLQIERATRMPAIERSLAAWSSLIDSNMPLIVTGDFNSPAHTDWTDAVVGSRKFVSMPVPWPVSRAMTNAGFRDSWREVFKDVTRHPGLTWWAARPPLAEYAPGENDVEDRIDFIWYAGPVEAASSRIVGETGGPDVSIGLELWPSDHRAVVSGFRVVPVNLPHVISTANRVNRAGDDLVVLFHAPDDALLELVDMTRNRTVREYRPENGARRWIIPGETLEPGHYEARMSNPAGSSDLVREFWVQDDLVEPKVSLRGQRFAVGESIEVQWEGGPGNRNDYLAAYRAGESADYENGLAWTYVGALPRGETFLDETTSVWGWPLVPGEYVIRLVEDDGYEVLAESARFTVESTIHIPANLETFADGRRSIRDLYAAYQSLVERGWLLDVIGVSQPVGTRTGLPLIALRSPREGPATWILAGIHGEEPAGPNAVAATIEDIARLGERHPVVLMPLLNPHGYVRNWRYLNVPVYSESIDGKSVGDSSHLLQDPGNPDRARGPLSNQEAGAITRYILETVTRYPPRVSVDLHEDNLLDAGYVYSQGILGAADPLAAESVEVLRANDIGIKMTGKTRFDEVIVNGIIGPVVDSSIDEFMSSAEVIVGGQRVRGPAAETVLVFETPAADISIARRIDAHAALIRRLIGRIANGEAE